LRERFQKDLLRRIFDLTSLSKELTRNTKHSRTESSYYFGEGRLVSGLRSLRQVEFKGVFNPTLQMRSSSEDGGSLAISCAICHLTLFIFHFCLHVSFTVASEQR
jgi:hypothetical protein